jgi:hypothetical protein
MSITDGRAGSKYSAKFFKGGIMKYAVLIAACALMSGCGDADEDTGEDTAVVAE